MTLKINILQLKPSNALSNHCNCAGTSAIEYRLTKSDTGWEWDSPSSILKQQGAGYARIRKERDGTASTESS